MENIKVGYIPVRQVVNMENRKLGIKEFIKRNKVGLIITSIFCGLISVYSVLIVNFINLIKILN